MSTRTTKPGLRAVQEEATTMRVALYARISDNPEHDELGVKRQMKDARKLAQARGAVVVMERVDNDISATKGAHRPGYEDIMDAADAGLITHIVIWQTSRLWRNRRERADGIERLAKARVSVIACKGPELDMTTAYGRGMAGLVGEFDTMESEVKSERVRAKVIELAEAGAIANGGPRPFGYVRVFQGEGPRRKIVRDDLDEEEADIIRDAAERLLNGDSLRSIVRDLNERGVKTSTGKNWTMQAMRIVLRSGRIAGLREHRGQVIGPAVWPAIIDEDTHKLLRAKLDNPERNVNPGERVRKHYLSGWVLCDNPACLAHRLKMRVRPANKGRLVYVCPPVAEGGCNGRVIGKDDLEKFVKLYMTRKMNDPKVLSELARLETGKDDRAKELTGTIEKLERKLAALQVQLDDLDDADDIPELVESMKTTRAKVKAARAELASRPDVPAIVREDLPGLAKRWDDLSLDKKQSLLRLFIDSITIAPGRRGVNRFDPGRVDIVPRQWR